MQSLPRDLERRANQKKKQKCLPKHFSTKTFHKDNSSSVDDILLFAKETSHRASTSAHVGHTNFTSVSEHPRPDTAPDLRVTEGRPRHVTDGRSVSGRGAAVMPRAVYVDKHMVKLAQLHGM